MPSPMSSHSLISASVLLACALPVAAQVPALRQPPPKSRVVLELDTYVPASRSADDSRGPIRLVNPQNGPVMTVASRSQAPAVPTPEAVPLTVIRIDRFESLQTWGGATTAAVPFVVTQTDTDDLASAGGRVGTAPNTHPPGEHPCAH